MQIFLHECIYIYLVTHRFVIYGLSEYETDLLITSSFAHISSACRVPILYKSGSTSLHLGDEHKSVANPPFVPNPSLNNCVLFSPFGSFQLLSVIFFFYYEVHWLYSLVAHVARREEQVSLWDFERLAIRCYIKAFLMLSLRMYF